MQKMRSRNCGYFRALKYTLVQLVVIKVTIYQEELQSDLLIQKAFVPDFPTSLLP